MDLRNVQVSPREYLQLRKFKISEEMKCLKDFVQQYNSISEMKDDIMDYFQSLRRDIQDIESSLQCGEPPVSSSINETDQHYGQEITPQNAYFGPTLYQESDVVMSPNRQSLSCSKRKRWSKVWDDFTKYVSENGKEWAKCKHCKKKFVGSSKSGTTHLKNHLKSCLGLRTSGGVADKEKEKSVIALDLNGSTLVQRIIKNGLNSIKDDILVVYNQEKCKLCGYLDKLPSGFSVTIELLEYGFWYMRIWFVDDSWELRNRIIYFNDGDDVYEIMKFVLVDWNIHRKICFVTTYDRENEKVAKNLKKWFNEQGSLPFNRTFVLHSISFAKICWNFSFHKLRAISPNKILTRASNLRGYVNTSPNDHKFKCAVEKALSMGKIVTSQSVPHTWYDSESLLKWVVGCKEAFCELEHIDPHFKFVSFTKEDWDDATLLYSCWQVIEDLKKEMFNLSNAEYKTANAYFSMVCHFFLKLDQLKKSDNSHFRTIASCCQEYVVEYWKNSGLVLEMSIILDPRCKMEMVECYYKMIYDNDAEAHLHKTIDDVTKIFNNYVKGTSSSSSNHDYNSTSESELSCYLRDNKYPQDEEFDILQWWRDKSPIYPTLARMARDLLSIPFKTPHLDSSLSDEIEDILICNSLDDDFKNKLACTEFWLNTPENY